MSKEEEVDPDKKRTRVVLDPTRGSTSYDVLVNERRESLSSSASGDSQPEASGYIVGKGRLVLLNSAWFGTMLTMMVMIVAAIPAQIDYLVGRDLKAQTIAIVATVCSLFVLLCAPGFGYLSDNFRSKYGRRRVFMLVGISIACVGLLLAGLIAPYFSTKQQLVAQKIIGAENMTETCNITKPQCSANSSNILTFNDMAESTTTITKRDVILYLVSIVIYFVGHSLCTTAFTGLIADKTHPSARGFSSGIMGVMVLGGNMAGAGVGMLADHLLVVGTFSILAVVSFVSVFITCYFIPEAPSNNVTATKSKICIKDMFVSYFRPFKSHDFRYIFLSRFLLQMGVATSVGFLEYWLDDTVHLPGCMSPIQAVSLLFIPMMVFGAISSGTCGILTDKVNKRKIFVYFSGVTMASCVTVLMFVTSYWLAIVIMIVVGVGYGAFVAVDMALVFDILPDDTERAKDLAVWHQALILPQLIATPLGGAIVHGFQHITFKSGVQGCEFALGYKILFAVTAAYFLISLVLVKKLRKVT